MTSKAHVRGSIRLASRERAVPVHREVPELFCLLYTALKLIVWVRAVLREESLVLRLDFLASWDLFFLMLKQDGQLFCLDSGCFQEDCYIVAFFFFSIKHNFFSFSGANLTPYPNWFACVWWFTEYLSMVSRKINLCRQYPEASILIIHLTRKTFVL